MENLRLTPEKFDVDWKTLIQWLLRVFEGLFLESFPQLVLDFKFILR